MTRSTILDLDNKDARKFFLRSDCYCNFSLPIYFDFQPLLESLSKSKVIPHSTSRNTYTKKFADLEQDDVNYLMYSNKDGKLAWRPLQLVNPVAYVYLVNIMTEKSSWNQIKDRFETFHKNSSIKCCSMPLVDEDTTFDKGDTINEWHKTFEMAAIKKSLEFSCMLSTDISNCYGSIYTHSIAWALHPGGRRGAKDDRGKPALVPNAIDRIIEDISNRQTNGIPQGSILMDFIAEAVLGYADYLLSEKIVADKAISDDSYYILRYRDDYRIFALNKNILEKIARYLNEVLMLLNLRLNETKTKITENIITDAQKSDKLYWQDIFKNKKHNIRILQIHSMSEKYPNSGSIDKALTQFFESIEKELDMDDDLELIASVVTDIAYRNPRTYPYATAILGKIGALMDGAHSTALFNKIVKKFSAVPNSEYLNIWLQRLSKQKNLTEIGNGPLCQYVREFISNPDKNNLDEIWHHSQCEQEIRNIFKSSPIINLDRFDQMQEYPEPEEVKVFKRYI